MSKKEIRESRVRKMMRLHDGAYCPLCGKWISDAFNVREDYEQDEQSSVIECRDCEIQVVAYINPIKMCYECIWAKQVEGHDVCSGVRYGDVVDNETACDCYEPRDD